MGKTVPLTLATTVPVASVVELLEEMLKRAQRGELRGVAVAAVTTDRCTASSFSVGDGSVALLIAANQYLAHRLVTHEE